MSAWATTIISGLVLVVAFMQWRTAHQKVMLDLFDRRLNVYNRVQEYHRQIMSNGVRQNVVDVSGFHDVRNEAYFLFGNDITALLGKFHEEIINLGMYAALAADIESEDRKQNIGMAYDHLKRAFAIAERFDAEFGAYMRMDQKRVRTPAEWLQDRNRMRLSYADEKQK